MEGTKLPSTTTTADISTDRNCAFFAMHAGIQNLIPYQTYISDFLYFEN